MMHFTSLTLVGVLAVQALASPAPPSHALHERRSYVPKAWQKRSRVEGTTRLPMRIGLTQGNLHKGHDLLMEV